MLDIKKLLTKIMKSLYITVTSGNWTYRKYLDGTFEGWYSTTGTMTIGSGVGSLYQSGTTSIIALPITLSSISFANVTLYNTTYGVWAYLLNTSTTNISYRAFSAISRSSATYHIKAYVKGTWGGVLRKPAYVNCLNCRKVVGVC